MQRYKDLLSLREKEIKNLQSKCEQSKSNEEAFKKQITTLEKENKDLSQSLLKSQRGISPFKVQSRSQYQMIDDLQDAIAAKGPINEEDLKNNYT